MADYSKYKKVYSGKRLNDYLKTCKDTYEEVLVSTGKNKKDEDENAYETHKNILKVKLPTVEGYAAHLKRSPRTLHAWAKVNKEFELALDKLKAIQKQVVLEASLGGIYNPTIAKLILSNNHGMKDRVDATSDDKPIGTNFTDDQIERIGERVARGKAGADNPPSKKKSD